MSTLGIDALQNRLGTKHPTVLKADFLKAWAHFTAMTTTAITASFGVASFTDNAVGRTLLTLTNPMAATGQQAPVSTGLNQWHTTTWAFTASSVENYSGGSSHTNTDDVVYLQLAGTLA